jgi:hypothetical protein
VHHRFQLHRLLANLPGATTTPVVNFSIGTTGVVDTGGKFFTDVTNTRWPIRHWYQQHRWQIATGIKDTNGKFVTGVNNTNGKIMGTISDYLHLNVRFVEATRCASLSPSSSSELSTWLFSIECSLPTREARPGHVSLGTSRLVWR